MSTLIICPACETRYEIAAVLPPEGRKVRCSKCSHVWQATAAPLEPAAAPHVAPPPPMPQVEPSAPPQAAPTGMPAAPGAVNTGLRGFAGIARPPPAPPAPLAARLAQAQPQPEPAPPDPGMDTPAAMDEPAIRDAEFDVGDDFEADLGSYAPDLPAPRPNGPDAGLAVLADQSMPDFDETDFEAFNAQGVGPEASKVAVSKPRGKPPPAVIGWGVLALLVAILGGLFMLAPRTVVAMLPGATRLYAMMGMPVNLRGVAFDGVRYGWNTEGGEAVLKVEGEIVNVTSGSVKAPAVVIALRDEAGQELSQWTTKVEGEQLAAGEHAPFVAEIASPPETVRSVKLRFAKVE